MKVTNRFAQPVENNPSTFRTLCRILNVLVIALIAELAALHITVPEPRHMETSAFPSPARIFSANDSKRSLIDLDFTGGLTLSQTPRQRALA
jgi:hypothetical protein